MTGSFIDLVQRYRSPGVLLDTNILLLYIVGLVDPERIGRFKRTAQYSRDDFVLLQRVLAPFQTIRTLPHVLAEVNSLSSQLPSEVLAEFRKHFRAQIEQIREDSLASAEAAARPEFRYLGLTDAAILADAVDRFLVITDDLRFFIALSRAGVHALNFTVLRSFAPGDA